MFRTPKIPTNTDGESPTKSPPKTVTISSSVRRSIGEWEAAGTSATAHVSPVTSKKDQAGPAKPRAKKALSQDCELGRRSPTEQRTSPKPFANRVLEARACLNKAKLHLNNSRNLKSDIKSGVIEAIDRLYRLVKESEQANKGTEGKGISITQISHIETQTDENTELNNNQVIERLYTLVKEAEAELGNGQKQLSTTSLPQQKGSRDTGVEGPQAEPKEITEAKLIERLQMHEKLLKENSEAMQRLQSVLASKETEVNQPYTYAAAAAAGAQKRVPQPTLHSIVIASKNEQETGEEVLNQIRETVNAKDGWVKVERVRKAKDRKIILSCRTEEDRRKIKEKIEGTEKRLTCEVVNNKDPLLILKDVLLIHSDEDIMKAIKNQNGSIFLNLDPKDHRMAIKYRRKARNPLTGHIVIETSPTVWRRVTDAGTLHIDLQRIRVEDQSPLVQCTRCLGYGHGKRFCKEAIDLCSHCGGPHLRSECTEWISGAPSSCKNCILAKYDQTDHNAFSQACPVRRKWDILARSSVAYC